MALCAFRLGFLRRSFDVVVALPSELPGLLSGGVLESSTLSRGDLSRKSGLVDPMLLPALAKGDACLPP